MRSKVVSLPHSLTKFAGHVRLTDRKTTTSPGGRSGYLRPLRPDALNTIVSSLKRFTSATAKAAT